MTDDTSFLDDLVSGVATLDDLDNYIDYWHDEPGINDFVPLHIFLGLRWEQWILVFKDPLEWDNVIESHRNIVK